MALPSISDVSLPIRYEDGNAVYFFFTVPTKLAAGCIDPHFQPAELWPGTALVALCFFEYINSSIGSYNELGLGVMVHGHGSGAWLGTDFLKNAANRDAGFYVIHLPVTSEIAEQAGKQIWGFPKFVTEIPFKLDGNVFSGSVLQPNSQQALFEVESKFTMGIKSKGMDLLLFNRPSNRLERTVVRVQGRFTTARSRNFKLKIGSAAHPLCDVLRTLRLDQQNPICVQYTTRFIAQLHAPEAE